MVSVAETSLGDRTQILVGLVFVLAVLANVSGIETNRMLVGAILVLAFGLWYLTGRGSQSVVPKLALIALGGYLGWLLLASFPSGERSASLSSWFLAGAYAVFFLAGLGIVRAKFTAIRSAIVFGGSITAIAALVQGALNGQLRIPGLIGNSEPLGAFLAIALPLAVAETLSRRGRLRWLAGIATGAIAIALLASFSYTAWVGLVLGVCVVLLRRGGLFGRAIRTGVLALLTVLVVLVGIRFVSTRNVSQAFNIAGTIPLHSVRISFDQRVGFQEAALRMAADHPWLGVGPATYQEMFPRYAVSIEEQPRYAHNRYLELAAEAGLPALLLYCIFLYAALRRPAIRLRGETDPTVVAIAAAVAVGLVAAAVDFGTQFPVVAALWWLLLGILVRAYAEPAVQASRLAFHRVAAVIVSVLATIVLLRGVDVAAAGAFASSAQRADARGESASARALWEKSIAFDPDASSIEALGWNLLVDRSDPRNLARAWTVTEQEGRWNREGYFRFHLRGRIAIAQDDLPRAETQLKTAIALDPWFHVNFPFDLAFVLHREGKVTEAEGILTRELDRYHNLEFSSSQLYLDGLAHSATLLGDLYQGQGRTKAAVRAYRYALHNVAEYPPAVQALDQLHAVATPAVLY